MRYFTLDEFDSPDAEGSGSMMDQGFLDLLDEARDLAGVPFVVTSGFRTVEYNRILIDSGYSASKNSSHLLGLAADIRVRTSSERWVILDAMLEVGFTRLGIGENFIHCDTDTIYKQSHVIWTY